MHSLRRALYLRSALDVNAFIRSGGSACYSAVAHAAAGSPIEAPAATIETKLANAETKDQLHASKLRKALEMPVVHAASAHEASPSESQSLIELFRLHNSSLKVVGGHMIKAKVIEVDKKKITLDTGMKLAKISVSDITPECIIKRTIRLPPRAKGEVRPGDIVQVYLEHEETPEGDMLVSGQQAAVRKRVRAVWRELQSCMQERRPVKGRILNAVPGGYSVGVGGLVCFVPNTQLTKASARRIGELQEFRVVQMTPSRSNVVLEDNRLHLGLEKLQRYQNYDQKKRNDSRKLVRDVVIEAAGLQHELSGRTDKPATEQQQQQAGQALGDGHVDVDIATKPDNM